MERRFMSENKIFSIGYIDFDSESNKLYAKSDVFDEDPSSPYTFRSDLELFPGGHKYPSLENYIGMDSKPFLVSKEARDFFAKKIFEKTGRNLGYRQNLASLKESSDAWQLLENIVIDKSMITVVLPPNWEKNPKEAYPIYFSGHYDNGTAFFMDFGLDLLDEQTRRKQKAITVFWNGGGIMCCRTVQPSVYSTLNEIFDFLGKTFAGDLDRIITFGGSRGGITALLVGANPKAENYRVRGIVSYNAPLEIPSLRSYNPYSYPLLFGIISEDTGFKYAHRDDFRHPDSKRDGMASMLYNIAGIKDEEKSRTSFGGSSQAWLNKLVQNETSILLHAGTHDIMGPLHPNLSFVDRAREMGLKVDFEAGFMAGHTNATSPVKSACVMMDKLLEGEELCTNKNRFYRKKDKTDAGTDVVEYERYSVSKNGMPLLVTLPSFGVKGSKVQVEILGRLGLDITLSLTGPKEKIYHLKIDSQTSLFSYGFHTIELPDTAGEYRFQLAGKEGSLPMKILEKEPKEAGRALTEIYFVGAVGPGFIFYE